MITNTPNGCCCTSTITANSNTNYNYSTTTTNTGGYISDYSNWITPITSDLVITKSDIDELKKLVEKSFDNRTKKEKEEKTMNTIFNLKCGLITDESVCLTTKGVAARNQSKQYVRYNSESGSIEDVTPFVIKGNFLYSMPVAYKDIKPQDIIVYNNHYYSVISFNAECASFTAIDLDGGEIKTLLAPKSPFGFNYLLKVVSPFSLDITEDEPFGNIGLLMLMNNENKNNMLPWLLLTQKDTKIDPMMLMFMVNSQ